MWTEGECTCEKFCAIIFFFELWLLSFPPSLISLFFFSLVYHSGWPQTRLISYVTVWLSNSVVMVLCGWWCYWCVGVGVESWWWHWWGSNGVRVWWGVEGDGHVGEGVKDDEHGWKDGDVGEGWWWNVCLWWCRTLRSWSWLLVHLTSFYKDI